MFKSAARYFAITIVFAVISMALPAAPALCAGGDAPPAASKAAMPEVRDCKTTEVCVLSLGEGSDAVSLGSEKKPAFESNGPASFAVAADGTIYVLDTLNFRVLAVKDGKVARILEYPAGESNNKADMFYVCDIAVSPKDGNIYLLNYTMKNIFIMSPAGEIKGEIRLAEQLKSPNKMFVAANGNVYVHENVSAKTIGYTPEGKVFARIEGNEVSTVANSDGFLYTLGEFDTFGRDILLMDPESNRKPKIFGKLIKTITDTEPYDYQIVGADNDGNFVASIIEKIREDVIQTMFYKFAKDGKVVSRLRVFPFPLLEDTYPTRYFVVSATGDLYGVTTNAKRDKYVIVKVE